MSTVLADTHAVIWYIVEPDRLSRAAKEALDGAALAGDLVLISAISLVDMAYLTDKGRLPEAVLQRLQAHLASPTPVIAAVPLDEAIAQAVRSIPRDLVPDMPDRVIAATALHMALPLVTRDQRIRSAEITTVW